MTISAPLRHLLEKEGFSGAEIIAASRGVLAEIYSKEGAENIPGIMTFVSIDDQTDNVDLLSYGSFNSPSYREYFVYDDGVKFEGLGPPKRIREGTLEFEKEMEDVLRIFGDDFRKAKLELLQHLSLN